MLLGSAKDIVEHCGVPRFLYSDFPLGNPCGHPYDRAMQRETVRLGLGLLESATAPRTTVQSPFAWKDDPGWRKRYNHIGPGDRVRLLAIGDARRAKRGQAPRAG